MIRWPANWRTVNLAAIAAAGLVARRWCLCAPAAVATIAATTQTIITRANLAREFSWVPARADAIRIASKLQRSKDDRADARDR